MVQAEAKARRSSRRRRAAARLRRLLKRERDLWESGLTRVAGVDEAGMGPLAGPVVAAAVIFPPGVGVRGVDDSKRLAPERRWALADEIRAHALAYRVALVDPPEIDRINIYQAGLLAMRRAVEGLAVPPEFILVDGRQLPGVGVEQERIVKGDARCHAIAAASILAKTARDAVMSCYDRAYPGYGFAAHKGYPTASHRDAIRRLGSTPIHRRSFTLLPQPRLWD
jgi:ribonuclease HII